MVNDQSELAEQFWVSGSLSDCPIIDVHGHMGEFRSSYLPRRDVHGMIRSMDQCNVRLLLFCGHEALFVPHSRHGYETRHH